MGRRKGIFRLNRVRQIIQNVGESVRKNFRHATFSFLFILAFVNVFQAVFGPQNSIVGVIFTIMMSASMARDLTATPVKNLCIQTLVLLLMAASACFVSNAPPLVGLPVNLLMLFVILYAFTYEYVGHLYFPYILSYLFLVFISPVAPEQLPKRLAGMAVGAACILLYQWVNGRKRIEETTCDVLVSMTDRALLYIRCLLTGGERSQDAPALRADLCKLSKLIYDRRRRALCISDASFAALDAGRGLENLILLLYELEGPLTPERADLLRRVSDQLSRCRAYVLREARDIPPPAKTEGCGPEAGESRQFYRCLCYIRGRMLSMTAPERRRRYHKTLLSFSVRLKAALRVSPVRVVYALRVSCLLALCTLFVQLLQLPHGKWLLFTVASVSLPYADDVGAKAKKRLAATIAGGLMGAVIFSLVPSMAARSAVMMLSGYLSFYFSDYTQTFALSTVGALGGAVLMGVFGLQAVAGMTLVRLGYIVAGILVGLTFNCLFFPFRRKTATRQLWQKYVSTTELLTKTCREESPDPQLYYGLVIQAHLLEDKLSQNARDLNWAGAEGLLDQCRSAVRMAHRSRVAA